MNLGQGDAVMPIDHRDEAERLIAVGNINAATAHALIAIGDALTTLVGELREDDAREYWPAER